MIEVDMGLNERTAAVRERIERACSRGGRDPGEVTLIAVSKTFPAEMVEDAYRAGLREFGENRVQEGSKKAGELAAKGIQPRWRLIGHLQTNKVATALSCFDVIHSVDSDRLLASIARYAEGRLPVHMFVQVNVADEASKSGVSVSDAPGLIARARETEGVILDGLMTIAPMGSAESAPPAFRELRRLAEREGLEQLSMGMSGDFEVAIEEGATHVRIGQAIFGGRA
jgi:pyridoxal phosphate enzyme (YggS family)